MHVLKYHNYRFDYLVGSQSEGFETMVNLDNESELGVFEGDEYLSSPIDPRPKFHLYKPYIGLVSGIAWDHINVFPTFEEYIKQFQIFINCIEKGGTLIYYEKDENIRKIIKNGRDDIKFIPYTNHPYINKKGELFLLENENITPVQLIGEHNMENIEGARLVLKEIGVSDKEFYSAISGFKGAAKRLQLINKNESIAVYLDFAHSPSKLKATIKAVKEQYPEKKLVACMELHTFSSLNKHFLTQYVGTMNRADMAIVFYDPKTIEHKKLPVITINEVKQAFGNKKILVYTSVNDLKAYLEKSKWENTNLLLMSSGNFSGMDIQEVSNKILKK
jgi:UDP-N-acetylmuramate: L-alanyl-gamma-D-glutamyl-meso-diaminopimelate ligase